MREVLTIGEEHIGNRPVLQAVGEIDLASAPMLEEKLAGLDGSTILDLSRVSFIDSTGLRVVLLAAEAAKDAGHVLPIVVVEGPVLRLLDITGVRSRLALYDSAEAAAEDS